MLLVEVGVDQLGVGGVDDGGPVGGRKHVLGPVGLQGPQRYGLGAQAQPLALRQRPCGCIHVPAAICKTYIHTVKLAEANVWNVMEIGAQAQPLALRQRPCGCIHVPAAQVFVRSIVGLVKS